MALLTKIVFFSRKCQKHDRTIQYNRPVLLHEVAGWLVTSEMGAFLCDMLLFRSEVSQSWTTHVAYFAVSRQSIA